MKRGHFPLDLLPAWCALNDVKFVDVKAHDVEGRGYGLVAEKELVNENEHENRTLLKVPRDLILSSESVEEYAKENKEFRQLFDAAGHQPAVSAKLSVLTKEFDSIKAKTESIPIWYEIFSIDESITVRDWVWLDALYRSRSLELPVSGESLVPCLDLANHAHQHTAYFEENDKDEVVLLLRDGVAVSLGAEVTINYGETKSAAEMLFSYGFIDSASTRQGLSLPLRLMDDDPLLKAKLHAFGRAPTLDISEDGNGVPRWSAPFVYLMCLNEEDGLDFRILQETDGSQQLKMFWQEKDVTDVPDTFKDLIRSHDMQQIFELRAVTVILEMVQEQLERLDVQDGDADVPEVVRAETLRAAIQLRNIETALLRRTLEVLKDESANLLQDESVLAYFKAMEAEQSSEVADDKDFS
ncbi:hypothetical protein SLS62_004037 [Diatrype stigma]|uniref:SET domain-containing protein n=1 Tax=Diatrype stigma TaxID=117547 RepID=A0AAN9URE0_9PEZI